MGTLLALLRGLYRRICPGIKPVRPRHDVAGVVAGPAPAEPPALLRADLDVAVAAADDQADYGHTTALTRKDTAGVRR